MSRKLRCIASALLLAACSTSRTMPMPDAGMPRPTTCTGPSGPVAEGDVCDERLETRCVSGTCETPTFLAIDQGGPYGIAVVGDNVYWTNRVTPNCVLLHAYCGSIMTAAITSENDEGTVLWTGSGVDIPTYLASNGSQLGFTCSGPSTSANTMSVAGGAFEVLFLGSSANMHALAGCAMNATTFFWADTAQSLFSSPIDGSTTPQPIGGVGIVAVAADATHVYWSDSDLGTLQQAHLDGSGSITLASGLGDVEFIAVDGKNVYYTDTMNGVVAQIPIGGDPAGPIVLSDSEGAPLGLAVDATDVYWAASDSGVIRRTAIGGGGPVVTIAAFQGSPTGVALDATSVYWTAETDGDVMRLAK
jgi:hypothetical protein